MQFFSLSGVFRNFVVSYLDNIFLPTVESTLEGEDRGKGNREKGGGRKEKKGGRKEIKGENEERKTIRFFFQKMI